MRLVDFSWAGEYGKKICRWLQASSDWMFPARWTRAHWLFTAVWLTLLLALEWKLGLAFANQTNLNFAASDQGAYLELAGRNRNHWWPTVTDGVRNPLFPWLLTPWFSPDTAQFFATAKRVNLGCAMAASLMLACFYLRLFPLLSALSMTTISALAVLLPIATFVGGEVIFYLAFFFLWVCCWRLLVENRLSMYACAGVICAIAYLAKPSVLLLLLVFALLCLARWCVVWQKPCESSAWSGQRLIMGSGLFVVCFLIPVLPRTWYAQAQFGDPFQNTAQYCFWAENWPQAYEHMGYFSKRAIGQLPPGEQPSAVNYWKQHTLAEMTDRLVSGMPQQANNFLSFDEFSKRRKKAQQRTRVILPFRGAYLFVLGGVTLGLAVSTRRAPEPCEIRRSRVALWLLTGLAFAAHFLAFSFYTPIAPGARLIMCAYLPVLFALAMGIETLRARSQQRWLEILYRGTYVAVAAALLSRMVFLSGATEFGDIRGAF